MSAAQRIQAYLRDHGIKQAFIAEKCGWSRQKTSCIISGRSKMTADDFLAICDVIGVSYDHFNGRLGSTEEIAALAEAMQERQKKEFVPCDSEAQYMDFNQKCTC